MPNRLIISQRNQQAFSLGIHPWEDFMHFLEKQNAEENFQQCTEDTDLSNIVAGNPTQYLNESFMWDDTPQGYKYWRQIHNKWQAICERRKYARTI